MIKKVISWINNNRLFKQGLIDTNYYLLSLVASRLIGLLIIPVFARLLTREEFASFDLFILSSSFLVLVTGLGIDSGVTIKIAENKDNPEELKALLFASLAVNTAVTILLWAVGSIVWIIFPEAFPFAPVFVHGLFAYSMLYQFNYITYNFIRWMGKAKIAALINFTSYVLGISGGFLLMILTDRSVKSYIVGSLIGSLIGAVITSWNARAYFGVRLLSKAQFKDLMILSVPYVPTYLANYMMQFIDRLLITTFFGLPTLGLYALVNRVGQLVTFGLQVISSGFRPVITSNYASEEGQSLSRKIFSVFWIASPAVAVLSIGASPLIITVFGGDQYQEAARVFPYVIVFVWFLGSFFLFGFGFQIKRKTIYVTLITLLVAALTVALSFLLVKYTGFESIAQATAISGAVGAATYVVMSERLYSFNYSLKLMFASIAGTLAIVFIFA